LTLRETGVECESSQVKPLFVKLGLVEADLFDQLQQRALSDIVREDFAAVGQMTTVLGTKSPVTNDPVDDVSDMS
jgi:hypothetical protein